MARLIYAFLAFALGTLVAGFLIRDSSVPLLISIVLSGLVLVMILFGTSRRLRRDAEHDEDATELAELEIVELDEEPSQPAADEQPTIAVPRRRKPTARPPRTREVVEEPQPVTVEDEPTIVVPEPPRTTRRRARPAASRAAETTAPAATVDIDVPEPVRPPRRTRASGRPARASDGDAAVTIPAPAVATKVWVIPGRSRYHTHSCRFAKGDQLREVTEATARRRGYVPCTVCHPDQPPP